MKIEIDRAQEKLKRLMKQGRVPVIVMGAGASAGVRAPTTEAIHKHLENTIPRNEDNQTLRTIHSLLAVLLADRSSCPSPPRSVRARLYHLLQDSADPIVRKMWLEFGKSLLSGRLQDVKDPIPLWGLQPSSFHFWGARLALEGNAVVTSLNYDGLTQHAINTLCKDGDNPLPERARILSSPEEIRGFFAGRTNEVNGPPIPVIKFRGDVFHANCENERCPDNARSLPLYNLLERDADDGNTEAKADALLRCPSCGETRRLRISFPGVFGKEREIEEAVGAFHEMVGGRVAGIVFMGFSGEWDETLVSYLVERVKQLDGVLISVSKSVTPALFDVAEHFGADYSFLQHSSSAEVSDPVLENLLPSKPKHGDALPVCEPTKTRKEFPAKAFSLFDIKEVTFSLPDISDQLEAKGAVERSLVVSASDSDTWCTAADLALETTELKRLHCCRQLGAKVQFLGETETDDHTRLAHSASAGLLSMIWHEALLPQARNCHRWASTKEARLALLLAALYHDARHLPFSHMIEDIFEELHWGVPFGSAWPSIPQYRDPVGIDGKSQLHERLNELLGEIAGDFMTVRSWWETVHLLQNGMVGIPWLEAFVDSAIDVDKIDYVFRDTRHTGQNVRLSDQHTWLQAFLAEQSLTPEGLIRLEGTSATAALALMQERMYLYRHLYLAPELRGLEALVRHVVMLWLKWRVPESLKIENEQTFSVGEDWRADKARAAGELLWEMFRPDEDRPSPRNELYAVEKMVTFLCECGHLDSGAIEWLNRIWSVLAEFKDPTEQRPSPHKAQRMYSKLAPVGPFYVHRKHERTVREIVRRARVHFPFLAIVDIAKFPRFLATPKSRYCRLSGRREYVSEQFLVPGERPGQWQSGKRASTPLHACDFSSFELPALQLLILDPWGSSSGGAAFVWEMIHRELKNHNIDDYDTPELVPKDMKH